MGKTVKWFLVICFVGAVAGPGYLQYRTHHINLLYAEAAGYPPYFRNSAQSIDAVRKLASYRGAGASELLLKIALGQGPLITDDVQGEAIKALATRNYPDAALAIAELLQPHEGLDNRIAAAKTLQSLPCDAPCVRLVLHYLERIWWGEPNYEDRDIRPQSFQDVTESIRKDQKVLYDDLYGVLKREKEATLVNLVEVYGLGSDSPSRFALELVPRLGLSEACPLLLRSERDIKLFPPETYSAPREELATALTALKCK